MSEDTVDGNWTRIAGTGDVGEGEAVPVEVAGLSLALFRVDGAWYCTDNVCTHAYALLTDGWLEGCLIECPLHNGQFDVRTGEGQGAPIIEDLRTYPVRVEGDAVLVALP
ncbi:non-heme iron oxygenase ferredoxin subunit [Methylobacterium mesophilicum]|uniref:non-heme iron oxygenase ferredoxin subunit n=1 Tax=Methylobacterium mesophilicum TaxID=39956 RepID=UPI0002C6130D|nr:non-heme iron oxygenase ferredoxin subunit [Methylobacterium mesophilicum]